MFQVQRDPLGLGIWNKYLSTISPLVAHWMLKLLELPVLAMLVHRGDRPRFSFGSFVITY